MNIIKSKISTKKWLHFPIWRKNIFFQPTKNWIPLTTPTKLQIICRKLADFPLSHLLPEVINEQLTYATVQKYHSSSIWSNWHKLGAGNNLHFLKSHQAHIGQANTDIYKQLFSTFNPLNVIPFQTQEN